jgi:O-antigen ligase
MRSSRARPLLVVATGLTLFAFAFPTVLADLGPGPLFIYRLLIFPADLTLAVVALAAVAVAVRQRTWPALGTALLGSLTLALAVALAFNPSPQGLFTVARFAGATGLAFAISKLDRDERLLAVGVLATVTFAQLGLAIAQEIHGGPLGLPSFGETADPLLDYGPLAPRGTMHGQYVLAGISLIAALLLARETFERTWPYLWSGLAGIAIVPVGMTMSRAAALGVALACGALALGFRRRPRLIAAAILCLALGFGLTAVAFRAGWLVKVSVGVTSAQGRETLNDEAFAMIASSPLIGIGPGRSVFVLRERYPIPPVLVGYQPEHSLPLLAAVEGGVVAGALMVALLVALGWRARRDVRALALFGAFLPFVLTDHYPYTLLQGLVLLGVWVGALDGLSSPALGEATGPPRSDG